MAQRTVDEEVDDGSVVVVELDVVVVVVDVLDELELELEEEETVQEAKRVSTGEEVMTREVLILVSAEVVVLYKPKEKSVSVD